MKDTIELLEKYAEEFFGWFVGLLSKPFSVGSSTYSTQRRLIFLAICAVVGATVGAMIPGRPSFNDRFQTAVTVVVVWTFISVLIHAVCRVLRGQGTFDQTVLCMLQLLAVAYVASNTVTMVVTLAEATVPRIGAALSTTGLKSPGDLILFLQFCIVAVYAPMILKSVHRFGGLVVGSLVGLVAALLAVLIASPVVAARGC